MTSASRLPKPARMTVALLQELAEMTRPKRPKFWPQVRILIEWLGWPEIVRQLDEAGMLDQTGLLVIAAAGGAKAIVDQIGVKGIVARLDAAHRLELLRLAVASLPRTKRRRKQESHPLPKLPAPSRRSTRRSRSVLA
jgi:hypothetical protein